MRTTLPNETLYDRLIVLRTAARDFVDLVYHEHPEFVDKKDADDLNELHDLINKAVFSNTYIGRLQPKIFQKRLFR